MADDYDSVKAKLIRQITAQKALYKFRTFLYSLNKQVRHLCFNISRTFLENELNSLNITTTEHGRLQSLLSHWVWEDFDTGAVIWWNTLSTHHYKSLTLLTLIHVWIDDIQTFDPDAFESSTQGIQ